ncbi:MAG TPA: hypothetical protein PLG15_01140 [Candidatus Gastranaerophilaceae bacterium]|nr:hypothetical protein [Candidatus Gastranaerophilaceae bacterium]HPT40972.1 hypothetical protein [Candidatus Gastranaerophilaceae bacterium]
MKKQLPYEKNSNCIFKLNSDNISSNLVYKLKKTFKKLPKNKSVAINLQNVEYVCSEFLEFLKEFSKKREISLFNIQAEISALFYLTKYDKFAHIYLNDIDFYEQKRMLLNRNFSILNNFKQ